MITIISLLFGNDEITNNIIPNVPLLVHSSGCGIKLVNVGFRLKIVLTSSRRLAPEIVSKCKSRRSTSSFHRDFYMIGWLNYKLETHSVVHVQKRLHACNQKKCVWPQVSKWPTCTSDQPPQVVKCVFTSASSKFHSQNLILTFCAVMDCLYSLKDSVHTVVLISWCHQEEPMSKRCGNLRS